VNNVDVTIDLPGVAESAYRQTRHILELGLAQPTVKNREAICSAFLYVLRRCAQANPSDLWHHIVYRLYCETLRRYRSQDPSQSWVRASGDALELAVQELYAPVLEPEGLRIRPLLSRRQKRAALVEMGIEALVGHSKLDVALYVKGPGEQWCVFGGAHIKASLAERVSDDVPCSRAMMARGYWSPLWTLDVKSFPPPHGDLVNRGELGSPLAPSEKRKYVEVHGEFDNCYSANARTVPSEGVTASGKVIYALHLAFQPDQFARDAVSRALRWKQDHRS
jgi:hypothetical protein